MSYVMVSFRSLPVPVKELIQKGDYQALEIELQKARYSSAVRLAARHHFKENQPNGDKK